jgi:hypothetical protein
MRCDEGTNSLDEIGIHIALLFCCC